uniref:Uncharacterized protein n=1 Tax=Rhizophora mucronata TaxID=61149 RepID=A0A2P2J4R5_RHIMU
MRALFSLT